MKKISKKVYAVVASVLILGIVTSTLYYNLCTKADNDTKTKGNDYANIKRGTEITVDTSGVLKVSRREKEEIPMGNENTWTLFIYMTGSNLETQYQNATKDIQEMFDSKINNENIKNVNIIIQTGGSFMWHSNNIDNKKVQRYKVDSGTSQLTLLEELGNENMGSADTLYNFLEWGVTNYPAEHMGVIFWDHGSGVESGLCNDERFKNESLSVHELEYSFAKVDEKMTSKFEMVGFDTCLSGSLEYANLLAPYAKYMVASSDLEPGDGWFYTPFIDYLLENPDASGADVGKVICENYALYYDIMYKGESKIEYTLSTFDLSKVDKVCVETNYLAKYMYDLLKTDSENYWALEGFRTSRLSYNKSNLDMGSILDFYDTSAQFNYNTTYFRQALEDFIVYNKISSGYTAKKAMGITLYLPSRIISLKELNTYRNVCFSPYWLQYIEWMNTRTMTSDMGKFKETKWESSDCFFEDTFEFLNYDLIDVVGTSANDMVRNLLITSSKYSTCGFAENWYNNVTYGECSYYSGFGGSPFIDMIRDLEVKVDENKVSTKLKEDDIKRVNTVYNTVFANVNDTLVCLGDNNKVTYDKKTGEIKSDFDGKWWILPDGQLLTAYIYSQEDGVTIYSIPVEIDSCEASIRIQETIDSKNNASYETLGVWDSVENNFNEDNFTRGYLPINSGSKITPIYDVFNLETGEYETEYGDEYVVGSEFEYYISDLEDGEYSFAYAIDTLDKKMAFTELRTFKMQDKKMIISEK